MIPAPHQRRPCVEDSPLSLIQGDMGPSLCKGVTSSPCAEKCVKVRSHLMLLCRKVREGEESASIVICFMLLNTAISVQPLTILLLLLFSAQPTLSLSRYANLVYLEFRRSLAYLHQSAASPPNEHHYWWE